MDKAQGLSSLSLIDPADVDLFVAESFMRTAIVGLGIFMDFLSGLASQTIGSPIEFRVQITTSDGWKHLSSVWFPLLSVPW